MIMKLQLNGVLLITVLMGNGLVAFPKRLWFVADVDGELKRLYLTVGPAREFYVDWTR